MTDAEKAALVPITEQISCVRREIGLREKVYPRFVEQKHMSQTESTRQLIAMRAVLMTLEDIEKRGRLV